MTEGALASSNEPHSEQTRHTVLSLYIPAFILALGVGIAAPALPVYAKSFNISFGVASLVIIVNLLGGAVATLPTGYLVDHIGRRKVVLLGPILTAIASLLIASAHSFPELLVYRFIEGWAQQMWMLGRLAVISDTGGSRRGRQITGMFGMDATGRLLGPAIGGFTAAAWGIRAPFVLYGVVTILAIIPSFLLVQETRMLAPQPDSRSPRGSLWLPYKQFLVPRYIGLFVAQFFAAATRGGLVTGTLDLYAVYQYGVTAKTLGFLAASGAALGIPLTFGTGHLMDRFGRKRIVVPGFSSLAVSLFTMALTAYVHAPFAVYVVVFLCARVTLSSVAGSMQVLGSDLAPPDARGAFFGLWSLLRSVGAFVSPGLFALMSESQGFGAAFTMLSTMALTTAVLLAMRLNKSSTNAWQADAAARADGRDHAGAASGFARDTTVYQEPVGHSAVCEAGNEVDPEVRACHRRCSEGVDAIGE